MLYPENDTSIYLRPLLESGIGDSRHVCVTGMVCGNSIVHMRLITHRSHLRCAPFCGVIVIETLLKVPHVSSGKELCNFGQNGVPECGTVYCRQRWNIQIGISILSSVLKNIFRRMFIDTMASLLLESELCVSVRSSLDLFLFQFGVGTFTVIYVF